MAGKADKLIFANSEKARDAITVSQQKEIAKLYEDWADEIGERAKYYSHKSTASAPVSERYYRELQKQLRQTSHEVSNEVYKKIRSSIYTIADAVVADNVKWLESFGFSPDGLNVAFSYVPDEIVRNLVTGQIYESGWSLSSRIWGDNEQTLKDIYQVMARGLSENKPVYEIAKDLESYVRPSARLPWNLRMADGKKVYKKQVDYNAQRLARTLVQHGYQQSFIATTQKNPFITEYVWRANGSRVCDLCRSRDGVHYKKDELPMDHPNGMCTMEPVVADDMVDQLVDWFNSPDGTYPEIDEFAENFGYIPKLLNSKGVYEQMTKGNYETWLKSYSTRAEMERQFKQKYGMSLQDAKTNDEWIEGESEWLSDIAEKYMQDINRVQSHYGEISYVQDADGSKMINAYWRSGADRSTCMPKSGRLSGKKLEAVIDKNVAQVRDASKALDRLIQVSSVDKDISVDRWAGVKSLERMGIDIGGATENRVGHAFVSDFNPEAVARQINEKLVGAVIEDKGYMSASVQSELNVFKGSDIKYTVQVPKGTNAFVTENAAESEIVFGKGTKQEIVGAKVIETEAEDYDGEKIKRQSVEIIVRILSQ